MTAFDFAKRKEREMINKAEEELLRLKICKPSLPLPLHFECGFMYV